MAPFGEDFSIREIKPNIRRSRVPPGQKLSLVEHMPYLYVKLCSVSSNLLPDVSYIQVRVGDYQGQTRPFDMSNPMLKSQIFAFNKEHRQSSRTVEILVKDMMDLTTGQFSIFIAHVPTRRPGDSPLAPKAYSLEDENGVTNGKGEVMVSAWMGNQGDEAFLEAWNSDAASVSIDHMHFTRAHMYTKPRLWYLRVKVMEAQDLVPVNDKRPQEFFVRATLGGVKLKTQISASETMNPKWSEELIFVAAEPFQESLILTVEQPLTLEENNNTALVVHKDHDPALVLGFCEIPLKEIDKILQPQFVSEKWVNLERWFDAKIELAGEEKLTLTSKICVSAYLDGTYHVFDEPAKLSSDLTATSPKLKPGAVGVLEVGILKAERLAPMKKRNGIETADAFCLAKYGGRWHKTRTVVGNLAPKWNEQYQWEVYEPSTVLTVGVFDNCELSAADDLPSWENSVMGKVRIRLSTLERNQIYAYAYPLVRSCAGPKGVIMKKMGELHLFVRFTCYNNLDLLLRYTEPPLPTSSYYRPICGDDQIDTLRSTQAVGLLRSWFRGSYPPLAEEVVEYMLDAHKTPVSSRQCLRANFKRVHESLSCFLRLWSWFDDIRQWNTWESYIALFLLLYVTFHPVVALSYLFQYLAFICLKNYRKRPRHPAPCLDAKLYSIEEDETASVTRYDDDAQSIAGKLGDLADQLERVHCLFSWRDPTATFLFMVLCVIAAAVLLYTPFRLLFFAAGFYLMRPPRFRPRRPSMPQNILCRLPTKEDRMI
ncbi:hypothetical protein Tsubulata_021621 [Turnera subulata]|uniref:C2 domain-containing protein n=1 Tax=Turnera subulata TaxID=218843 RepID=A0A9Q0JF44_9ROSI|nr:hypothetical protein Tsubulata_021621 [Turnera subulata]